MDKMNRNRCQETWGAAGGIIVCPLDAGYGLEGRYCEEHALLHPKMSLEEALEPESPSARLVGAKECVQCRRPSGYGYRLLYCKVHAERHAKLEPIDDTPPIEVVERVAWEYRIVYVTDNDARALEERFNELGGAGWELMRMTSESEEHCGVAVFGRLKWEESDGNDSEG